MLGKNDFAEKLLSFNAAYHNHKETMAYSIFALEGAFFLGLFLMGNWPPSVQKLSPNTLAALFVITWFFFHTALRFQLRNRKLAAIRVAACVEAMSLRQKMSVNFAEVAPEKAGKIDVFIDTYFLPTRNAFRSPDVSFVVSGDLHEIEPGSLEAVKYFELETMKKAQRSWTGYAIPIEWITTIGSILLLGVALLRVFGQ